MGSIFQLPLIFCIEAFPPTPTPTPASSPFYTNFKFSCSNLILFVILEDNSALSKSIYRAPHPLLFSKLISFDSIHRIHVFFVYLYIYTQCRCYRVYSIIKIMIEQKVDPNPQSVLLNVDQIDVSDIPSNLRYFMILSSTPDYIQNQTKQSIRPYIFTYTNEKMQISELLKQFLEETGHVLPQNSRAHLTLRNGIRLSQSWSVQDLKQYLNKEQLDGTYLFLEVVESKDDQDSDEYIDQCCVTDYCQDEPNSKIKSQPARHLKFELISNKSKQIVYLDKRYQSGKKLAGRLLELINNEFGLSLGFNDIENMIVQSRKYKLNISESTISNKRLYNNGDLILVNFKNKNLIFNRKNIKNYNSYIIIYKEQEKEPGKFKYEDIAEMMFEDFYKKYLELEESKSKIQAIYCLKIMDLIIKPKDKISIAERYFKNTTNKAINVVGKVVNEKMVFYHVIPALAEKYKEFTLEEISMSKEQVQQRQICRKKAEKVAANAPIKYFKDINNLEPIFIYTSDLRYKDTVTKKDQKIYVSLNKFLRENNILSLDELDSNKEWRLRYASSLIKHLLNVTLFKGITYRGVSYDPHYSKGDIVTFKQFTSTSQKLSTAKSFSQLANKFRHVFIFQIQSGRSIKQYSYYDIEAQILLEPFTEFKVTDITIENEKGSSFKYFHLKQILTSKILPNVKANFIIWIDDKTKEGQQIYNQIKFPKETTLLEQLTSTAQLQEWLNKKDKLLNDPTANVVFITNMTRIENQKPNYYAGIDGLKLIRQKHAKVPVFFYIGDKARAEASLKEKQVDRGNVFVGNSFAQIRSFIDKYIAKSTTV